MCTVGEMPRLRDSMLTSVIRRVGLIMMSIFTSSTGVAFLDAQVQSGGSQAYANYVFGVYMASAGYSLQSTLNAANGFGGMSVVPPSPNLPDGARLTRTFQHRNVTNITQGFKDAQNGTLCNPY